MRRRLDEDFKASATVSLIMASRAKNASDVVQLTGLCSINNVTRWEWECNLCYRSASLALGPVARAVSVV